MEIDNKLVGSVIAAALFAGGGSSLLGMTKLSTQEEEGQIKFASYETLCKEALAACEERYAKSEDRLQACWAAK